MLKERKRTRMNGVMFSQSEQLKMNGMVSLRNNDFDLSTFLFDLFDLSWVAYSSKYNFNEY